MASTAHHAPSARAWVLANAKAMHAAAASTITRMASPVDHDAVASSTISNATAAEQPALRLRPRRRRYRRSVGPVIVMGRHSREKRRAQCARRWAFEERPACRPPLAGFGTATAGGAASTAGWTRAAGLGGTMGSEAADEACVTAPVATEPDGAMWAFSAMRPATIRPPITTKYFRISITSPWARKDRRTPLVAAAAGLVHFRSGRAPGCVAVRLRGGWRRGNGFEPPSRAVHARALPIELPCRRSDSYPLRPRRSVQNCTPARAATPGRRLRDATPEAAETGS